MKPDRHKKRILVAPLNWGLGHATRCIPIINALIEYEFEPIIASDGSALDLLRKEFPKLKSLTLPSYNITYPKKERSLRLKLIKESPHLLKTIKREKKIVETLVNEEAMHGIISDNRFGVRHKKIPSVFITHQLQVLSGNTTWFSTKLHQQLISKFDQCWVPDYSSAPNLSGKLGHVSNCSATAKYIGPLSRFNKVESLIKYKLLVLLSGPEPQRTYLEEQLLKELRSYSGKILFIKGEIENEQTNITEGNITIFNFMTSVELEKAINESEFVLSRSGYTTIMDLAKLQKNAFFIPTPGQFEQEYLARKFTKEGITASAKQSKFTVELLNSTEGFSGFNMPRHDVDFKKLFSLF